MGEIPRGDDENISKPILPEENTDADTKEAEAAERSRFGEMAIGMTGFVGDYIELLVGPSPALQAVSVNNLMESAGEERKFSELSGREKGIILAVLIRIDEELATRRAKDPNFPEIETEFYDASGRIQKGIAITKPVEFLESLIDIQLVVKTTEGAGEVEERSPELTDEEQQLQEAYRLMEILISTNIGDLETTVSGFVSEHPDGGTIAMTFDGEINSTYVNKLDLGRMTKFMMDQSAEFAEGTEIIELKKRFERGRNNPHVIKISIKIAGLEADSAAEIEIDEAWLNSVNKLLDTSSEEYFNTPFINGVASVHDFAIITYGRDFPTVEKMSANHKESLLKQVSIWADQYPMLEFRVILVSGDEKRFFPDENYNPEEVSDVLVIRGEREYDPEEKELITELPITLHGVCAYCGNEETVSGTIQYFEDDNNGDFIFEDDKGERRFQYAEYDDEYGWGIVIRCDGVGKEPKAGFDGHTTDCATLYLIGKAEGQE